MIAIIAILAAILFPVFAAARERARAASCVSNHRQIGMAAGMYSSDYDDTMFLYSYVSGKNYYFWFACFENLLDAGKPLYDRPDMGLLYPYLKGHQVEDCPTATGMAGLNMRNVTNGFWPALGLNIDYLYSTPALDSPVNMAAVQAPCETILMGDVATFDRYTGALIRTSALSSPSTSYPRPTAHMRHLSRATVVWCDGHVKSMPGTYKSNAFNPWPGSPVTGAKCRSENVGMISPIAVPDRVMAGDPMIPQYDYYFTLRK